MKYYKSDPLAYFLINRLNFTPVKFAVILPILAYTTGVIISLLSDTFRSSPGKIGFLQQWIGWVWLVFFFPVLGGYYIWVSNAIQELIQNLIKTEVVDISNQEINETQNFYKNPLRTIISCIIAVGMGGIFYISRSEIQSWASSGLLPKITTTVGMTIGGYI